MWMKYLNAFVLGMISPVKSKTKINTLLPFDESYAAFTFTIINQQSYHEKSKNTVAGIHTDAVPAPGSTAAITKRPISARKPIKKPQKRERDCQGRKFRIF